MNKVLLFYPSFTYNDKEKPLYTDMPLSVAALAARLHNKYEVEIIDERIDNNWPLRKKLNGVMAVGISATTSKQITNGLAFAEMVREYDRDIRIIWGGWHPSLMPEETIRHRLVDIVVIGQGEDTFENLLDAVSNQKDLRQIPNIIYKTESKTIIKTKSCQRNSLQMPESMIDGYRHLNMQRYVHPGWGNDRVLGYESSRGCLFSCGFCSINAVYKQKWYNLPPENIVKDIRYLKDNHNIDAVHFFDNNLFINKNRAFEISSLLGQNNLRIKWDGTVVTRQFLNFTAKEINDLKKSGFYRIIAGIESGDEEVLIKINKRHTNEEVLDLVKRCGENDIIPSLSFMIGFPWNPEKDTVNTMNLIERVKTSCHQTEILLFVFSPYLGTPLYDIAQNHDMKFPNSLDGWADFTYDRPNTPWISDRLRHKMDRYLSFMGTKELSAQEGAFYGSFGNGAK